MSNKDFDDKSVPYKYVGIEMDVCPNCGEEKTFFKRKCKCQKY